MVNSKKAFSFLTKVFETIILFHMVSIGAEEVSDYFNIQGTNKLWAWSCGVWVSSIFMLITLCFWRHSIYQERIEDCAAAKAKLEKQVLKDRQSSIKKPNRRKEIK